LAFYFPGPQFPIALTLATGIHRSALQDKIDACEAKAIQGADFNEVEIIFLRNLYTCLHKGARLTVILPEVSKLMEHYLAQSGEDLEIDSSIFKSNEKVLEQMDAIKRTMSAEANLQSIYRSEVFYMPDSSNIDSVFGLYYGHVEARPERIHGEVRIEWRAEVPWEWPSYASLKAKHGDYLAESFPIPSASCLFLGINGAIYIDNGLGQYLTQLGIAKSFLAYAEWTEKIEGIQ